MTAQMNTVTKLTDAASFINSLSSSLKFIAPSTLGLRLADRNGQELGARLGLTQPASKAIVLAAHIEFARVVRLLVTFALFLITEENALISIIVFHMFGWLMVG